jgi:N-acetylglucosaminyldiphosphoundecaprenol N-acetyl-beta-D-mannosaminyltransferase
MDYRVTCICGGYGFPISASAARIIMVGKALQGTGIELDVLHCGPSPITLNNQRAGIYEGIRFHYTTSVRRPENKFLRLLVYARALLCLTFRLAKLWPVRRSTVIYLYVMDGFLNLCAGALCQLLGLTVVQELCEWFPSRPSFTSFNRWLYKNRLFQTADGALVISRAIEERVVEQCKESHPELVIHRVGVMVDADRFASAGPLAGGALKQVPNFVWCGTWLNDVFFLIRTFALVRRAGYHCRLKIIGECGERSGPVLLEYARKEGLSPEDIILTGCIDPHTLESSYKAATALLMPLWKDDPSVTRLPNKMGEYLASGRPVITCAVGDLTNFLADNVNAYVGDPGSERSFADKMLSVLEDPDRAEQIGITGQQTCFALLDYQTHASGLAKFFACSLEHHKERPHVKRQLGKPAFHNSVPAVATDKVESLRVLGSTVHLLPVTKTVDQIEAWVKAKDRCCRRVTVSGFHGLLHADKDQRMHSVLNGADLWVPDGIAPVLIAKLSGYHKVRRTTGTDLMLEFFRRANERAYSSYFYGETEATLAALIERLGRDFPGHRVAGVYAPPFRPLTPDEDAEVIARINAAHPDILWVALGMPKQDVWIYERLDRLKVPVAIGVGAAFAFVAGTVPRCPEWIGHMGFEWAYRTMKEPRKLWRRVLIDGSTFLVRLGLNAAGLRRPDKQAPA